MSERERLREREPEAAVESTYDQAVRSKEIQNQQMAAGKVVVSGRSIPWETTRQGRIKYFMTDRVKESLAAPGWVAFQQEIHKHSGMHRHQGGTFIYVLSGKGYSTVNGARFDWEAGDLTILPVMPGGVAHQHFNLDPAVPAVWMRIGFHLHKNLIFANWIEQIELSQEWAEKRGVKELGVGSSASQARTTYKDDGPRGNTLFDALLRLRDEQREEFKRARMVIQAKTVPVEINPMGLFRWYVHPQMNNVGCRAQIFYVQELPPGSRSGKQLHQGGRFHYVLEGKGRTVIDGTEHEWEKDDVILLPVKSHGVVHQHFNDDPVKPAKLIVTEPNWVDVWGVDLGSGFEMLEPAPEYGGRL